jgi:hypothetical protein
MQIKMLQNARTSFGRRCVLVDCKGGRKLCDLEYVKERRDGEIILIIPRNQAVVLWDRERKCREGVWDSKRRECEFRAEKSLKVQWAASVYVLLGFQCRFRVRL